MRLVYFGSGNFSAGILERLKAKKIIPCLVITTPDRPKGRGRKISSSEVGRFAEKEKLPVLKPASLNNEVYERLEEERADIFVVVDYGKVIPSSFLNLPEKITLGLHPSLLPYYRGPAPINWVIMRGERLTGISIFKVNDKVDSGDIILQRKVQILPDDDIYSLTRKLINEGGDALREAVEMVMNNTYQLTPQDERLVSFAPKLKKDDGRIRWEWDNIRIKNLVKATLDWPSAYTFYKGQRLKIIEVEVVKENSSAPGSIVRIDREGIYVGCGKGVLRIKRLKPQGKKEMEAKDFICGYRPQVGDRFI